MGADLSINPPAPPPKDHVVVVTVPRLAIYGPYRRGQAAMVRLKLMTGHTRGPRKVTVRKLKRYEDA